MGRVAEHPEVLTCCTDRMRVVRTGRGSVYGREAVIRRRACRVCGRRIDTAEIEMEGAARKCEPSAWKTSSVL